MKDNDYGTPGYAEYLTPISPSKKMVIVRIIIAVVSLTLLTGLLMLTSKIPQVFVVWLVIIAFFAKMSFDFTKRECEYIIATGELELSVIYGARVRRKKASYRISDLQTAVKSSDNDASLLRGIASSRIFKACRDKDAYRYLLVFQSENGEKSALYISAPDKTVSVLKYYKRSAVM